MKEVVLIQTGPVTTEFKTILTCDWCDDKVEPWECYQTHQKVVCYECAHRADEQDVNEGDRYGE